MVNRRPASLPSNNNNSQSPLPNGTSKKRKTDMFELEQEQNLATPPPPTIAANNDDGAGDEDGDDDNDEEEVKLIGNVVRVSGEGDLKKNHYLGFENDGVSYRLEDNVLIIPEEHSLDMKPSVAIIKDIYETQDGSISVTGQRFYRPEITEKEIEGNLEPFENRELFYSFDKSEFPADTVMHKCKVHYIQPNKKIPNSKELPGFIVRKVYDPISKKLKELLDSGYEERKQQELNVLVQKSNDQIPN